MPPAGRRPEPNPGPPSLLKHWFQESEYPWEQDGLVSSSPPHPAGSTNVTCSSRYSAGPGVRPGRRRQRGQRAAVDLARSAGPAAAPRARAGHSGGADPEHQGGPAILFQHKHSDLRLDACTSPMTGGHLLFQPCLISCALIFGSRLERGDCSEDVGGQLEADPCCEFDYLLIGEFLTQCVEVCYID